MKLKPLMFFSLTLITLLSVTGCSNQKAESRLAVESKASIVKITPATAAVISIAPKVNSMSSNSTNYENKRVIPETKTLTIKAEDVPKAILSLLSKDTAEYSTLPCATNNIRYYTKDIISDDDFTFSEYGYISALCENDRYLALFGSLKSDKSQGIGIAINVQKLSNGSLKIFESKCLTPGKHGSVNLVNRNSSFAKDFVMSVKCDDGYEMLFSVYNGFY